MDIAAHYRTLQDRSRTVLETALEVNAALTKLTTAHNYLLDFERLSSAINLRPEAEAFNAAIKEYQFALFALSIGQYRHAFIGLRLFFELSLATIQFSAHEIDFRMWAKDTKDLNWNTLKDNQLGVFSINFINAFNPTFSDNAKQYSAIAEKVYRECSEFVHGNANTHSSLPADISFDSDVFFAWHQKLESMRVTILFAYSARYLGYIDANEQQLIEPIILDVLGHLTPVQAIFSKDAG